MHAKKVELSLAMGTNSAPNGPEGRCPESERINPGATTRHTLAECHRVSARALCLVPPDHARTQLAQKPRSSSNVPDERFVADALEEMETDEEDAARFP